MAHTFAELKDHCPVSLCWSKTTQCSAQKPFSTKRQVPQGVEKLIFASGLFLSGLSLLEAKVYSPRVTPYSVTCSIARSVGHLNRGRKQGSALCGLSHGLGEVSGWLWASVSLPAKWVHLDPLWGPCWPNLWLPASLGPAFLHTVVRAWGLSLLIRKPSCTYLLSLLEAKYKKKKGKLKVLYFTVLTKAVLFIFSRVRACLRFWCVCVQPHTHTRPELKDTWEKQLLFFHVLQFIFKNNFP